MRGVLSQYFQYHHTTRTHLSLNKDCPQPRRIQPPSAGKIIAFPEVGGLRRTSRRVSYCGDRKANPFRVMVRSFLQLYSSNAMAPSTHDGARVAAATNFYSTNQKSSVAIFIGKPIPRPDRFLSRDRGSAADDCGPNPPYPYQVLKPRPARGPRPVDGALVMSYAFRRSNRRRFEEDAQSAA